MAPLRDEAADDARMPGKAPERERFMTPLDDLFKLPNIVTPDAVDGPMPGQYQPGDPR